MKRAAVLLFVAIAVVGCSTSVVDLSAVKAFSSHIQQASDAIEKIPNDYASTCETLLEYGGETRLGTLGVPSPGSKIVPGQFNVNPSATLPPAPTVPPAPAPQSSAPVAAPTITPGPTCDSVQRLAQRWKQLNTTVVLYVKGLGDVAGVTTAPNTTQYQKFADAVASDGFVEQGLAEAVASFIAAVGNHIISAEQSRDIEDLVALSQAKTPSGQAVLSGVLSDGEAAAVAAHYQLVGTKAVVDGRYNDLIAVQVRLLRSLRRDAGLPADPDLPAPHATAAPRDCTLPPPGNNPQAAVAYQTTRVLQRCARIQSLRKSIVSERAAWVTQDQSFQSQDDALRAYVATFYDVDKINGTLVKQENGFAGVLAAIRPWVDDLESQTEALIKAVK